MFSNETNFENLQFVVLTFYYYSVPVWPYFFLNTLSLFQTVRSFSSTLAIYIWTITCGISLIIIIVLLLTTWILKYHCMSRIVFCSRVRVNSTNCPPSLQVLCLNLLKDYHPPTHSSNRTVLQVVYRVATGGPRWKSTIPLVEFI